MDNNTKVSARVNIKNLPNSEVEIEGELEAEAFEIYFNKALKKIGENVQMDGFRKGNIPEKILLSKIPESQILEEMADLAVKEHYPKIVEDKKLDVISYPEVSITKLARNNPFGFKIKTAIMPEVKLADYKNIAKEINSTISDKVKGEKNELTVSEEGPNLTSQEVENVILDIRKSRAQDKQNLPEFNDEFVRTLGPFENVEDFKEKLKVNLKLEKENQLRSDIRLKIIEKIINNSEIDLPEILVKTELEKILHNMEADITKMGMDFQEYLKNINKTTEDLRKEFRKDAEKKAKFNLILYKISELEKIIPDQEKVNKEVEAILKNYPNADRNHAILYVQEILTNEQVFLFLENIN
jgi:FKBP-type peptidyl-prolyl cis-trans isomerase (trigger factor)